MPRQNGRNYGRGRKQNWKGKQASETDQLREDVKTDEARLEAINKEAAEKPHLVFVDNAGFDLHYDLQESIHNKYWATLFALLKSGYEISSGNKALILAAAWAHKDHDMAQQVLTHKDQFGLVEVVKALSLLDSGRKVREWEKKLHRLELQSKKPKPRKLSKCKQNIDNLKAVQPKVGSVSGALVRHIRSWVQQQSAKELEYFALFYPKANWKKLADLCHLNPKKDFHMLPWFLPHCYGEPAPDSSTVQRCALINAENVNELVLGTDVPYSHIKQYAGELNDVSKKRIAEYSEKLSTVLWNYEDLACPEVDRAITERLAAGEEVDLTYGKLMERLLMLAMRQSQSASTSSEDEKGPAPVPFMELLMEQAERGLKNISVSLKSPVAVLGDRSPSMSVAIRTSTIIASLLASVTQAKLSFFASENYDIENVPTTVKEVIKMGTEMQTTGATAPAASLLPYYQRKEVVKTFVVVTDEYENTKDTEQHWFSTLYKKYYEEIYPADLVFVSFLDQRTRGHMVTKLEEEGFSKYLQFRFDAGRPDLTKLDAMLAQLSMETPEFAAQVERIAGELGSKKSESESKEVTLEGLSLADSESKK